MAHTLSASFFLFNCLTFKFSTVQIVLCTHIRTPTFCVRFFHSIWLFRGHFECFLVNFVSFLLLYPRICSRNLRKEWNFMRFVYRWWFFSLILLINTVMFHKTMNVHSRNAFEFKINKKILSKTSRYHLSDENVWFVFPFDVARCTHIEIQVIWHFVNVHAVTTHFYFARIHCAMHSTTISQFI